MEMDSLGMTSRWVAAARARESARPDRLFDDPLADALAGEAGRTMLDEMAKATLPPATSRDSPYLAIRTRFFDDALLASTREGTRQVVILAAGMDARAFRLDWPEGTTVFEVERAPVLHYKETIVAAQHVAPRARRVTVPVDLRDDWRSALRDAGHEASLPSAFSVEGLLSYLPEESSAAGLLADAASVAAPGSVLGADLVGSSFLDSPWTQPYLQALAQKNIPWRWGTSDPEALLERAGWRHAQAVQPGEDGASFGRWSYPVAPRGTQGYPQSFFALARR
jgi:methyltransferase (TIGR00027 family)